jgi:hypothetical protein
MSVSTTNDHLKNYTYTKITAILTFKICHKLMLPSPLNLEWGGGGEKGLFSDIDVSLCC